MKFINKTLLDGSVETICIDDDGAILEVRTHSKETINFLSQVNDTAKYSFPDGIWIPQCNKVNETKYALWKSGILSMSLDDIDTSIKENNDN